MKKSNPHFTNVFTQMASSIGNRVEVQRLSGTVEGGHSPMSDREERCLRGPLKAFTEEHTYPARTDAEGKTYPPVHAQFTTEFDEEGRLLATVHRNSDGSQWMSYFSYDNSGRLLNVASGSEGQMKQTSYRYDHAGRLQSILQENKPEGRTTFTYDERGRKAKIQISGPADYRPNLAFAGSPFEVADRAPNIFGGGTATTFYDEQDRATQVHVHNAEGELISRVVRTYDPDGRIAEEHQILDKPEILIPAEHRAKMIAESGVSADEVTQELRAELMKLMSGQPGSHSVAYGYDTHGHPIHRSRRFFNHEDEIETTYNDHGDIASQIEWSTRSPDSSTFSETRHSYIYDQHGNWIKKATLHRSNPEADFQPLPTVTRSLIYY